MSFLRVHHFEILRILRQSLPILAFRIFPAYGRVVIPMVTHLKRHAMPIKYTGFVAYVVVMGQMLAS